MTFPIEEFLKAIQYKNAQKQQQIGPAQALNPLFTAIQGIKQQRALQEQQRLDNARKDSEMALSAADKLGKTVSTVDKQPLDFSKFMEGLRSGNLNNYVLEDKKTATQLTPLFMTTPEGAFRNTSTGEISPTIPLGAKVRNTPINFYEKLELQENSIQGRQKLKDTKELEKTLSTNNATMAQIDNALNAAQNIPMGLIGKAKLQYIKNFEPNNPILADWQAVKTVLTKSQLLYTALTKGAISDKEMLLFANAVANDDINSLPRIKQVLSDTKRIIDAENIGLKNAYNKNYNQVNNINNNTQENNDPMGLFK